MPWDWLPGLTPALFAGMPGLPNRSELRMVNRLFGGNGSSKGFTNAVTMGPGWVLFVASQSDPPPPEELPYALSQGLEQWLKTKPGIRVRSTLPIIKDGNTIGIHVWFDEG